MVNLIVAKPKSIASAKTTAIPSQAVLPTKKPSLTTVSQKPIKQLKNNAIKKKNTKIKKVIKKSKKINPKSRKKFQLNQRLKNNATNKKKNTPVKKVVKKSKKISKNARTKKKSKINQRSSKPPIVQPVNIKPHSVKLSPQPVQSKPQLTTSAWGNKSKQSVAKTNAAGKAAPAVINNHHSARKSRVTPSAGKLRTQSKPRTQPLITSKRKNLPLTKKTIGSKIVAPVFLGGKPSYPWLSRRNSEEGKVLLRIQVNTQGKATIVQIKRSSGSARLDNAAVNHVKKNAFTPAQRDGNPIIAWKELRFVFKLN
jgi:TonB family protein